MRSKDVAELLRKQFPDTDIRSPFPKQVTVFGHTDKFHNFDFQGVSVEFKPVSERPSMFDGPRKRAIT